jgi:DNA-binding transcriptional LysR family regulator
LNEARLLLQRFDEAERRVRRTADGEEGELRLGYIGPPAQPFLGHIVKEYRRRYPRVSVVLEERTPERVWEMVARGRLSIGLTRPVFANRMFGLHTLLLRRERLCAVLDEGHPLAKARILRWPDLADEPLIVLSRREAVSLHDAVLAAFRRARLVPRIAHTPSLISTVLNYVEAGAGIGIVSDSIASLGRGALLVFRPLSPAHTVDFVMVWPENDDTPAAASFRALIHEWLQKKLLWNPGRGATASA